MSKSQLIELPGLSIKGLTFDVPVLKPMPKQRPYVTFKHGKAWGFSRQKTVEEETRIVLHARAAAKRHRVKGFTGPIKLEVWVYRPWPKSIPVSRRDPETIFPTTAPDLPNHDMLCCDALEKSGLIVSDGAICDIASHKRYREQGGWLITIIGEPVSNRP